LGVSALPFWWDGKRLVGTQGELEALYVDVGRRRGQRTLRPDRIGELADPREAPRYCGDGRTGTVLLFYVGTDSVGICVRAGKVIGFDD
jgi:hypothetical protein